MRASTGWSVLSSESVRWSNTSLRTRATCPGYAGLSRQTVRRAFQELAAAGAVYRVPGCGTFAVPGDGRYLRSFGSIDDLMSLALEIRHWRG
jgi:DNA-binding GntR family transcriptional regulator